ncbi:MAG: AcrR family transcriptional regulator [Maritalea sp.]
MISVRQKILESAVDLFWKQGVDQTSYADLVAASSVSRKALYSIWPDKTALVHDALNFYVAGLREVMIKPFVGQGRAGLDAFFDGFVDASRAEGWNGCFLMRSAAGPLREDVEVAKIYADYVSELIALIAQNAQLAIEHGQSDFHFTPQQVGRQFAALAIMMSVFASQPNQAASIEAIRKDMRDLLQVQS